MRTLFSFLRAASHALVSPCRVRGEPAPPAAVDRRVPAALMLLLLLLPLLLLLLEVLLLIPAGAGGRTGGKPRPPACVRLMRAGRGRVEVGRERVWW